MLANMGLEVYGAPGAFYVFFKAPKDMTDLEFVDLASRHNLILVPGRAFSRLHGFVRLSYGADMKTLELGVAALQSLMKTLKK